MPKKETKRQHYVPRTYLKHFSTERSGEYYINALPIADFNEKNINEISIANVCLQNDLYTLPGETPEERMLIEKFYSDSCESHYDKIYQLLTDPNKTTLTDAERELIISTVVTMFYRTTKWITLHNDFSNRALEKVFSLCKQVGKDYFMFENKKISIANKTLEQMKKENKVGNRPVQVVTQLKVALKLIELRSIRDGIYVTKLMEDDCEFVTSDNPVCIYNLDGGYVAPFDPENIMTLPLDNKHKLFLMPYSDADTKHILARHNVSGTMCYNEKLTSNYEQSRNAERFMLGAEAALKSYLSTKNISESPLTLNENDKINSLDDLIKKGKDLGLFK
jgi:hypothetical protein